MYPDAPADRAVAGENRVTDGVAVPGEDAPTEANGAAGSGGPTGHPLVDAALDQLERAASLPAPEQVAAYEETHRVLQQTLASIDQA